MGTPGESQEAHSYRANIQLQGFAAGDGVDGHTLGPRTKDPGAGANPEPHSVKFRPSSVHSEPDLDAIMPLPHGSYSQAHHSPASFRNWSGHGHGRSRAGSGVAAGRGASAARNIGSINRDAEDSESSGEEENDVQRSLVHSPRSIGFTNVEVSDKINNYIISFMMCVYLAAPADRS